MTDLPAIIAAVERAAATFRLQRNSLLPVREIPDRLLADAALLEALAKAMEEGQDSWQYEHDPMIIVPKANEPEPINGWRRVLVIPWSAP